MKLFLDMKRSLVMHDCQLRNLPDTFEYVHVQEEIFEVIAHHANTEKYTYTNLLYVHR